MEFTESEDNLAGGQCPRKSKAAIVAFILGIASIFLFPLTYLATIVLSIIAFVKIKQSNGQLKGKWLAVLGLVIPVLVLGPLLIIWFQDAPPLEKDYTIADLRSAPTEYAESYQLLKSVFDREDIGTSEVHDIGLSEQEAEFIKNIHLIFEDTNSQKISDTLKANENQIVQIWKKAQRGRDIINKLSAFDEIADLAEPVMGLEVERECGGDLITLAYVYHIYIYLQIEQGNHQDVIRELIKFDSVFRKLSINSRDFLMKKLCYIFLEKDIHLAALVANRPHISEEILQHLVDHFVPLTDEQIALRNPILFQSLEIKKVWKEQFSQNLGMQNRFYMKPNSTFRLMRNFWVEQLEIVGESNKSDELLSVWPHIYPKWLPDPIGSTPYNVPICYSLYNLQGSIIFQASSPSFLKRYERKTELKVLDDLFQWVLGRRMGEEGSLKARAYSDEYTVDVEKGLVFSVGPDGQPYSDDDIKLRIDPVVLGLK